VLDFTPDGKHVVVRMNRVPYDDRSGRPYLVPVDGGMEQPLPMSESGGGSLSPNGTQFGSSSTHQSMPTGAGGSVTAVVVRRMSGLTIWCTTPRAS